MNLNIFHMFVSVCLCTASPTLLLFGLAFNMLRHDKNHLSNTHQCVQNWTTRESGKTPNAFLVVSLLITIAKLIRWNGPKVVSSLAMYSYIHVQRRLSSLLRYRLNGCVSKHMKITNKIYLKKKKAGKYIPVDILLFGIVLTGSIRHCLTASLPLLSLPVKFNAIKIIRLIWYGAKSLLLKTYIDTHRITLYHEKSIKLYADEWNRLFQCYSKHWWLDNFPHLLNI